MMTLFRATRMALRRICFRPLMGIWSTGGWCGLQGVPGVGGAREPAWFQVCSVVV